MRSLRASGLQSPRRSTAAGEEIEPIEDLEAIYGVINDAALAYRDVIPADRWHEPYMPMDELRAEIDAGVRFYALRKNGECTAVMGLQRVDDAWLIRHAYTRTSAQGRGLGTALLEHLKKISGRPLLVGTWTAAHWAVQFYARRGFELVAEAEKIRLLKRYWSVPERQIEESSVLVFR